MQAVKQNTIKQEYKPALLLAERFIEAKQLQASDPILLWLIAAVAHKQGWSDSHYNLCFKKKRIDILAMLGFPARNIALTFLRKLNTQMFDHSFLFNLNYWLHSDSLHTLAHYTELTLNHIKIFRSCPELIGTKWSYNSSEIAQLKDVQPIIEQVNAGLRKAKQVGTLTNTILSIKNINSIACLEKIHYSLNNLLQIQWLVKAKVIYPQSPIAENKHITLIRDSTALVKETMQQKNCVWSYHDQIVAGTYFIYQVMYPERATLGVMLTDDGCLEVDQLLLQSNDDVAQKTKRYVQRWFKS